MTRDVVPDDSAWRGLVLPFVAVGLVTGVLVAARLLVEVPVAQTAFPARGQFVFTTHFMPQGGAVITTRPSMLRGLKLPYLAVLGGFFALESLFVALATGIACWRTSRGEWLPPLSALGWLGSYALGVSALTFSGLWLAGTGVIPSIGVVIVLLVLASVLFVTPAVVIIEQVDPLTGATRAVRSFVAHPLRVAGAALLVGYLGYLFTGVTLLFDTTHVFGYGISAAISTAVGGTVHVVVLLWLYRTGRGEGEHAADRVPESLLSFK